MALYYITDTNWVNFVQALTKQFSVYGLAAQGDELAWQKLSVDNVASSIPSRYRALTPVKSFFFPVKEEVTHEPRERKNILIGVKGCDINHLKTMDAIFLEGVTPDPYYAAKRQNTIIISADCDSYLPSCFCTQMGEKPYPEKGFDLNLSPARAGFLVETGSEAAESLISIRRHFFQDPQSILLREKNDQRNKMTELVRANNKDFTWTDPKAVVSANYTSPKWDSGVAATCVECDACRFACGSCYCFLLGETKRAWEKLRAWDSCQSTGYFRVAGGANPKKTRDKRLRNFYACKLLYRPENFGFYACTGCGRCIDVCQGKIDIRRSLQRLSEK